MPEGLTDQLLRERDVAAIIGISPATLRDIRVRKRYRKILPWYKPRGIVLYKLSEVNAYIDSLKDRRNDQNM